jgi:hypothetical protein
MIKILRLKDGYDVIAEAQISNYNVRITNPMSFEFRGNNMVLSHWLPIGVMDGNFVDISLEEVLCFMDPNTRFLDYYQEMVTKVNSSLDGVKEEDMELLAEAMDELENTKGISIH